MLRKKYIIVLNVTAGIVKFNIKFKRTSLGELRCNLGCIYKDCCFYWFFENDKIRHTSDICITYPRTKTKRYYYSPYAVKKI